ncbi:MAG: endoribonuclease MazF [Acidobacteria bacterium]|nr:endoribonuclease MazF [Acidobacteriota bacterium]
MGQQPRAPAPEVGGARSAARRRRHRGRLGGPRSRRDPGESSAVLAGRARRPHHRAQPPQGERLGRAARARGVVARAYVPDAGDLVWLTLDPQAGREQRGRRPALILSPRSYNTRASLAIACPITSHAKGYPFEVALPADGTVTGVVLADHVKNLDWNARRAVFAAKAPAEVVTDVRERLRVLIGQ